MKVNLPVLGIWLKSCAILALSLAYWYWVFGRIPLVELPDLVVLDGLNSRGCCLDKTHYSSILNFYPVVGSILDGLNLVAKVESGQKSVAICSFSLECGLCIEILQLLVEMAGLKLASDGPENLLLIITDEIDESLYKILLYEKLLSSAIALFQSKLNWSMESPKITILLLAEFLATMFSNATMSAKRFLSFEFTELYILVRSNSS